MSEIVMHEITRKIVDYSFRVAEGMLGGFPVAFMLSFQEAREFYYDLQKYGDFAVCELLPPNLNNDHYGYRNWTLVSTPHAPFAAPYPPSPRSGRVLWCTYRDVVLAIKGDLDDADA